MTDTRRRLRSLDILRGFDLIWILGAEKIWLALFLITGWPLFEQLSQQFEHVNWVGFHAYDLIFPLFIFISGVTIGLNGTRWQTLSLPEKKRAWAKAIRRLLLLVVLGIVYNHGWGQGIPLDFDQIRYASVLGRIGFCWFIGTICCWYIPVRFHFFIILIILLVYAALHLWLPLPGAEEIMPLTLKNNWNVWFDQQWLPGITYRSLPSDPEGLLSQIPAIANVLAGVVAGHVIKSKQDSPLTIVWSLIVAGVLCLLAALIMNHYLPIIKHLWTSSFALLTIGLSSILLALFYWLFDRQSSRRGLQIVGSGLAAVGVNSLFFYLLSSLVDWNYLSRSLLGGVQAVSQGWYLLLATLLIVCCQVWLARWLLQHKLIVKI